MTSPSPNEPPAEVPLPQRRTVALGWGLACAAVAGGVWLLGFLLVDYRLPLYNATVAVQYDKPLFIALTGGIGGLLGGLLVALPYAASDTSPRVLILGGAGTGIVGGALVLKVVVLCGEWLNPLASSTIFWCFVGFLAGLGAYRLSATTAHETRADEFSWQQLREWLFVRLLPLLALVAFLLHTYFVIDATRY
jgi:hypothetical protein